MKKLFVVLLCFMIPSCFSIEKDAQKIVKNYLKENLDDWDSYQSVKFGKLDSLYSKLEEDSIYNESLNKIPTWEPQIKKYRSYQHDRLLFWTDEAKIIVREGKAALDSVEKYKNIVDSLKTNFKPKFIGWKMDHSYRAKNDSGDFELYKFTFFLNKDLTKVVRKPEPKTEE